VTALPTPLRCLIDGVPSDRLPVTDRGLSYGDGLFETLLIRDGRPCQWRRHWQRLARGCLRLGLPAPLEATLAEESDGLLRGIDTGVLKILVTRGDGGRGYMPAPVPRPRRVLSLHPAPSYPPEWQGSGVAVRTCRTPASLNPVIAGLKHLNRLDNVLARAEWSDPGVAEGLMADPEGEIVGGTMTNLFLWDGAGLLTPGVDRCGIAGTVRDLALELAADWGIPCAEARLRRADLLGARGLFLTNSLLGVWPVRRLDTRSFNLGDLPLELIGVLTQRAHTPESVGS
jgi:4-amino-4-deoxychorismate lyase